MADEAHVSPANQSMRVGGSARAGYLQGNISLGRGPAVEGLLEISGCVPIRMA
jgi:hypothetical protein